jgi:hypothetical protein
MRSVRPRTRSNVALALLCALIALACVASSARAEAWGEVKHFSLKAGTGLGEINERGRVKFAAGSDGSYYVLTETPSSGELVLQRFVEGTMQAKVVLKGEEEAQGGTEGANAMLAVDPSRNRVYVLLVYERRGQNKTEEKEEETSNKPVFPLDDEMPAAGALYAFEYDATTKELVKKKGLTRKELKGQGEAPKEALLDPRGIAVDPETGDLAISGNQDEESDAKVEADAQKQCRAAVQFVTVKPVESGSKKGQIEAASPAARYVDSAAGVLFGQTGCGEEDEEEAIDQAPASPVFAPDGTVLGYGEDESVGPGVEGIVWQLTPAGADTHAPGEVSMAPKELFVAESIPTFAPEVGEEASASVMSLVPESATDGTIYLRGGYTNRQPAPAVLHYSHPSGGEPAITEVGWTAGGSVNANAGPEPCDLHKAAEEPIMLGGLSGAKRGFLALTYYKEFINEHQTEVKHAEVVEFGEGGSTTGCPTVPVTTPTQSFLGEPTNTVPAGTPLEITSVLGTVEGTGQIITPAAGAKSVRWTVKGPSQEEHFESSYQYNGLHEEEPDYGILLKLKQTLTQPGAYEISDEVHTDDLADEVAHSGVDKLTVTGGKLTVKPKAPEPTEVRAHEQEATLKAIVEVPGEATVRIKKIVWSFGDGTKPQESGAQQPASPATLEVKHTFSRCGSAKVTICKVKATVEAETVGGNEKVTEQLVGEIKVRESKAEEASESPEGGGNPPPGETTNTQTTVAPSQTTPTQTTPQPKGGVQGYIASFAGSSLPVGATGTTSIKISCPSGGSCNGTLTLQTLNAVVAGKKAGKKKVLTLASGEFALTGGSRALTLRLNSQARALLSHSHGVLRAKLTVLSRGTGGQKNSVTTRVVTLRLTKKTKH